MHAARFGLIAISSLDQLPQSLLHSGVNERAVRFISILLVRLLVFIRKQLMLFRRDLVPREEGRILGVVVTVVVWIGVDGLWEVLRMDYSGVLNAGILGSSLFHIYF